MAKHWKPDDLVIEIDCPKGERYGFTPCPNDFGPQRFLRSRHELTKLTPGARGHLGELAANMPPVPGQHIILNIGTRTGQRVDPLGWEDNKELLGTIVALIKSSPIRDMFAGDAQAIRTKEVKLTPVQVATWLQHMRRAVQEYTIRPVDETQKDRIVHYALVRQDWKSLLTCSDEDVEKIIPEWSHAVLALGGVGGSRTLPRTREEMGWYNRGLWEEYRKRRGLEEMEAAEA